MNKIGRVVSWPSKTAALILAVSLGSCCFGVDRPSLGAEIIRQVPDVASDRIAFVEEITYLSGFQTSVGDQVRIAERGQSYRRQDIVFTEYVEPLSEKPTVGWEGDLLTIYFSRDATVLLERKRLGNITLKFVRRMELVGKPPIGKFLTALKDSARVWNREDLTAKIWETCRTGERNVSAAEIDDWAQLLLIDRALRTEGELHPNIQVREVAFLCICELVAPSLLQQHRPLRQDLGTGRSGMRERFDIHIIDDSDIEAAKNAAGNYKTSLQNEK